ncbi:fatty acid hydroxylase domain-containing protein 2 [Lampetra fluviatilis]
MKSENCAPVLRPVRVKQGGQVWDSVQKAAFVLGTGLLVFAAARNTITWHLQQFWGASGDFWQSQWALFYNAYKDEPFKIFVFCSMVVPTGMFWLFNALLMCVDVTGWPAFFLRYKIQADKNVPVDPAKLRNAIFTVLANQLFISFPMVLIAYVISLWRGGTCGPELPTFHWVLLELLVFGLIEEVMFYYSHRLFHHPALYKRFHKQHHEWTAPIGLVSLYAHPLEHFLSNMLPPVMGPVLMGSHAATIMLWFTMALLSTSVAHCGYHLPLMPSPEFHDFHHLKFNQCFGVLGVLDRLHGTDAAFRRTKAYERHIMLLGLTPLSESIPETPKLGKGE